jgi:hypothetical protein
MRCYNLPPLKEISSRDLREEGLAQENDEGHIDHGAQRISRQLNGGKLLSLSWNLSFHACGRQSTL